LIVWSGGVLPPKILTFDNRTGLEIVLKTVYAEALADPTRLAGSQVVVVEGRRLTISGNPVRVLTYADGTKVSLADETEPDDGADGWLLPRAARGG